MFYAQTNLLKLYAKSYELKLAPHLTTTKIRKRKTEVPEKKRKNKYNEIVMKQRSIDHVTCDITFYKRATDPGLPAGTICNTCNFKSMTTWNITF